MPSLMLRGPSSAFLSDSGSAPSGRLLPLGLSGDGLVVRGRSLCLCLDLICRCSHWGVAVAAAMADQEGLP